MMENEFMLREKSRRCKQLFQRCLQNLTLNDDDWVEQKSAEFNWWKAGLNADKSGPGSLDSQLGLRPDVKEAIAEVLDNLATALLRFMEIEPSDSQPSNNPQETAAVLYHDATVGESGRSPSPWSDMTDGTGHQSELSTESSNVVFEDYLRKEQRSHVDINIEILLRIHAVIKKSGLKFRNKRADDQLKKDEDEFRREKERIGSFEALSATNASIGDHERFRGFLTRLVLHNGYTEGLIRYMESRVYAIKQEIDSLCAAHDCRSQHERSSSFYQTLLVIFRAYFCDPARLTPIQRRLVNANVVRRNRLVYAGGVSKLQSSGQQTVPQILKEIRSQEASLHTQNPKDYVEIIPAAPISQAPSVAIPESRTSFVSRVATELESNFSITAAISQSTGPGSAATAISARLEDLDYPKCPSTQGSFPCPYCPLVLSSRYTDANKWRAHVSQDLCPYTCIFENCRSADDMYATSHEWKSHMIKFHSVEEWVCTECLAQTSDRLSAIEKAPFQSPELLKEHIVSSHPELNSSDIVSRINASRRFSGIESMVCPLCRPGIVTGPVMTWGDEDDLCGSNHEDEFRWGDQERGDHIATHIHQFSLQALPCPNTIEAGVGSRQISRSSGTSPRQIIACRTKDDTATDSGHGIGLHSSLEIIETFRLASLEFHDLDGQSGAGHLFSHPRNTFTSLEPFVVEASFESLDKEAFLVSINECRIIISQLGQTMLSSKTISGQDDMYIEFLESLEKLVQLKQLAENQSDSLSSFANHHDQDTASPQRLSLERSMNQFRRELTDEQQKVISSTNREAINDEIRKIQEKLGHSRHLCNLVRIESFLDAMGQIEKLVTIFLNLNETVVFIWGPIKLALMEATTLLGFTRKLLDVYEEIADALDNLALLPALIKRDGRFSRVLEDYFSDIIHFHHSILDFLSQSDWKGKFPWAWAIFRRKVKLTIDSLKRKQELLAANSLQPHANLEEMKSSLQKKLDVSSSQIATQVELPDTVIGSSGHWIFHHPLFQSWETNTLPPACVLFLSGCPGAGKSTLAKTIVNHFNERQPQKSLTYFFFEHNDADRRSVRSMLCSIISQIIYKDDVMMQFVYDKCASLDYLDVSVLKTLTLDCLSSKRDTTIVLDGLDKVLEPDLAINWCLDELLSTASSCGYYVRLLICGQEDGRIDRLLSSYPQIRLDKVDAHQKDIEDYCKAQAALLTTRFRLRPDEQSALIVKVTKASNGMFLYTKVVLKALASMTSKKEFKDELGSDQFPRYLDEAYGRILQSVIYSAPRTNREIAKKILGWLVCSQRPLRWREIQSRFCIDAEEAVCDLDNYLVITCKEICSSLVDVTDCEQFPGVRSEQTITMIHETASKYLVHVGIIDLMQEHVNMSLFCSRYLSSPPFLTTEYGCSEDIQSGYFSFMDYAATYYRSHVQKAESFKEDTASGLGIDSAKKRLLDLQEAYCNDGSNTAEASLDLRIQERISAIRSSIDTQWEGLSQSTNFQALEGPKRYKCPTIRCCKFSIGYSNDAALQQHLASHRTFFPTPS